MRKTLKNLLFQFKNRTCKIAINSNVSLNSTLGNFVTILSNAKIGSSHVDSFSYIGERCEIKYTKIGKFCSVGSNVLTGLAAHPINFVSTYPGFYVNNPAVSYYFGTTHPFIEQKHTIIESDVWVGSNVTILGGVTVGLGAIIAAGAVVTKNVEPYSIVGGVPAKHINFRFDQETISKLISSKWWDLPIEQLKNISKYMNTPAIFLEKFNSKIFD